MSGGLVNSRVSTRKCTCPERNCNTTDSHDALKVSYLRRTWRTNLRNGSDYKSLRKVRLPEICGRRRRCRNIWPNTESYEYTLFGVCILLCLTWKVVLADVRQLGAKPMNDWSDPQHYWSDLGISAQVWFFNRISSECGGLTGVKP